MKTETYHKLKVDEFHNISFQKHGNPNGSTFLFLHGGPGIGTSPRDLSFFDLKQCQVILLDQRGCGRSTPKGCLQNNTTQHIINDIEEILRFCKLSEVYLFGGSWGSSLALLYALANPHKVKGMVLRGLFTCTKEERKYFEQGGSKMQYPQVWERFTSFVPQEIQHNPFQYYFDRILYGTKEQQEKYSYELTRYGYMLSSNSGNEDIDQLLSSRDHLPANKILAYYSVNDFFIPDNYLYNHIDQLNHIPIHLIHGIHDEITRVEFARLFVDKSHFIQLTEVDAGHSAQENNTKKALIEAVKDMLA